MDTGWTASHGPGSWGPGVVGHGYQEGGLPYIALYGLLVGWVLRYFDFLLVRDPSNPYILGIFAASSGQLIAWCRGDIGLFSATIIGMYVSGYLMNRLARMIFWTDHVGAVTVDPAASEYGAPEHPGQADWQYY